MESERNGAAPGRRGRASPCGPRPPRLMLITDGRAAENETAWLQRLGEVARDVRDLDRGDGTSSSVLARSEFVIQLREKGLETLSLLARAHELADHFPGQLVINGRWDVARACGAVGVHAPGNGLPSTALGRLAGLPAGAEERLLVGRSCHSLAEILEAQAAGVDYALFGPVWPTPAKARFGAAQGLERLARVTEAVDVPVLAVGGVTPDRVAAALDAGAHGVAAIRAWLEPGAAGAFVRAARDRLARPRS